MTGITKVQRGEYPLLYAHSVNIHGKRQWLADHLRNVAKLARTQASSFGGGDLAFLAGLWHDVGKADPAWQNYLRASEAGTRRRGTGPDHKCAGVLLAENACLPWLGLLIYAHHGGLGDTSRDFAPWLNEHRALPGPLGALEALQEEMPELTTKDFPAIPPHIKKDALATEFFLRMLYSALVDADSLDTEAHALGGTHAQRGNATTLAELWQRYEAFLAGEQYVADTVVNRVRNEVHEACLHAACEPSGLFKLTVPTGGGKTRSAMAFALQHGMKHRMRRVVMAVPFTTITQQTADVYRHIFEQGYSNAERIVLEHHSAGVEGSGSPDEGSPGARAVWQRLAAENWDAPIVVTTTVQLFESLFSNLRGKTRKLHNLSRSVIILDEAQALPPGLLGPILDSLRQLTKHYGASVVFSTATQPVFDHIDGFRDVEAREIVPNYRCHFKALKRVEYDFTKTGNPNNWSDVAEWMRRKQCALTIVNTKRHAMELLDALNDPQVLHISTLLCRVHRSEVLDEIRRRLAAGKQCRVVSTQVVEAGVDLDFDVVFRAEAPLDSIIQAAGRCNREGQRTLGRVVVFKPPDEASPPGLYRSGRDVARVVREAPDFDPNDPEVVTRYFKWLFDTAVDPDQHDIQRLRHSLDFPSVAKNFRMIADDACDVIVDYPDCDTPRIDRLVEELRNRKRPAREVLRDLQPHMVSLYRRAYNDHVREGFMEEVMTGVGRWPRGYYDPVRGITDTDPDMII